MDENAPGANCRGRAGLLPFEPGNLRRRKYISIRHEHTQKQVRISLPRSYRIATLRDQLTRHRLREAGSHGGGQQAQCDSLKEVITQICSAFYCVPIDPSKGKPLLPIAYRKVL